MFLLFKNFIDNKSNTKGAIFNIISKKDINLDSTKLKTHKYKNIENTKKI
jgi:hypothetical protein